MDVIATDSMNGFEFLLFIFLYVLPIRCSAFNYFLTPFGLVEYFFFFTIFRFYLSIRFIFLVAALAWAICMSAYCSLSLYIIYLHHI